MRYLLFLFKTREIPLNSEAENMAKVWSPDTIFTLDIGMANQKYYIIEAQCSNSSGFYDCNMIELVKNISEAVKNERRVSSIPRF